MMLRRSFIQTARTVLFSLGGEGLQSGFHFALNLALIRLLSTYEFGSFAIAFALGAVAITYMNALVSIPATVLMARLKRSGAVNYQDVVFGSAALAVSSAMGIAIGLGLWLVIGYAAALAASAFVGLWTLRHHVRFAIFARHQVAAATASDFSYAASGIVFVIVALGMRAHISPVTGVLLALAGANLLAIVVAFRVLCIRPRFTFRRAVWRRYAAIRSDVAWSLLGVVTWSVQSQALLVLVAAIAGPAAYAPVAAGMVLLSPLRPAIWALINVGRPKFAVALAEGKMRQVSLILYSLCAIVALSCLVAGAFIWLGWAYLEAHIFDGKFSDAQMPLIVGLAGLSAFVYLTYNVPLALIHAAGQYKPAALATTFGAIVGVTSVALLLKVTSVPWSLAGMAAGEAACGIYLAVAATRILRRGTALAWRKSTPVPINAVAEMRT
jgi:O-antigen/teichoic acid export membrane protein